MPEAYFHGKRVLITGATSGIGRATALKFASDGAKLVLIGRDAGRGAEVAQGCEAAGGGVLFIQADLTTAGELPRAMNDAIAWLGGLDVAFNNAGMQEKRAALADQPEAVFDAVLNANLRSVFLSLQIQIKAMLAQGRGGAIINNGSVSGVRNPNPGLSIYSASKAALISLTRSAALEYASQGIRINMVSPGRVETPMMLASGIADMSVVAAGLPIRRLGRPEEVAEAVHWLASPASSFIVGHNLCADGGFLAS